MIKFLTDLYTRYLDSGLFEISRVFKVQFKLKNNWYLIKIPVGRKTDLASIPRIFWSILPRDDRDYLESAILHDEFYKKGGEVKVTEVKTGKSVFLKVSRLQADILFREGAKVLGSPAWKAFSIFYAVRIGGSSSWNKSTNKKTSKSVEKFATSRKNLDPRIRG